MWSVLKKLYIFEILKLQVFVLLLHTLCGAHMPILPMALLSSALQETQLRLGGAQWVHEAERSNFLTANKEGIASLLAFVSLELWGSWIGGHVHRALRPERRDRYGMLL